MPVKINYKSGSFKNNLSNLVLFSDEKFNILRLKKHVSNKEYSFISELIKVKDTKKKILSFEFSSKKR